MQFLRQGREVVGAMDAPPAASSQGMGASATPVPSPTFGEGKLEMEKEKKKREKARARCPLPERIIRTRICYPCCGDVGFTPTRQGEGWGGQRGLLLKKQTNKPKKSFAKVWPQRENAFGVLVLPVLPLTSPGSFPCMEGLSLSPLLPQNVFPWSSSSPP